MPKKYHIHVQETPGRYPKIGRSGIVDWGEGCLKCPKCVKQECVYGVFKNRSFSVDIMADTIDVLCRSCFRCVQGCPKRLIHKTLNPEWEALGDDVYTPEIIAVNWAQAETGKIPVSGAGYGGAFSGPGFDSIWTDMSEIVRPTRDGIHGREYISTVVDLGRQLPALEFDEEGKLLSKATPTIRIPLPVIFDMPPFGDLSSQVWRAMAMAAREIGTRLVVPEAQARMLSEFNANLVPLLDGKYWDASWPAHFGMVEILDRPEGPGGHTLEIVDALKSLDPRLVVAVRMAARSGNSDRTLELAQGAVDVIHIVADRRGYEPGVDNGKHIRDIIREHHGRLLDAGIRDEITILAGGGIAMAEHVIKAMLCGANAVSVDVPLLIALECRACRNCAEPGECPVRLSSLDPAWGCRRIVNLVGAWHNQFLEMMGAMGIREARRLRGEQGRAMFAEDLEANTFARLFRGRDS